MQKSETLIDELFLILYICICILVCYIEYEYSLLKLVNIWEYGMAKT